VNRLVILICILFLCLDLADDGFMGKVQFLPPLSPVNSLIFHSQTPVSGQVDLSFKGNPADFPVITGQFLFPRAARGVRPPRKIVGIPHLASAGGLPW
jgi:hypothetical protein